MDNLRNHPSHPGLTEFGSKIVTWYRDFLLNNNSVDDETGFENGLFVAFGLFSLPEKGNRFCGKQKQIGRAFV